MIPTKIKILEKNSLFIKWDDNSETLLNLKYLRDECPCAGCKGETILLKTYRPANTNDIKPEGYLIKDIQPVGNYGIQITWKDGHNTGIYNWEYIKKIDKEKDNPAGQDYEKLI